MEKEDIKNNIMAGLVSGAFAVVLAISYASIIFTGHLAPYLPIGFGLSIISVITLRLVIAKYSSIPGLVPSPFVVICLFIAIMSTIYSNRMAANGLQEQIFPTTLALILLSTLAVGLFLVFLGQMKWGSLIRFFPYPVVAGLLAAIGLSMIIRGISVIVGFPLTLHNLDGLFKVEIFPQILVSMVLAYIFYKMVQGKLNVFALLGLFILAVPLFAAAYFWINSPSPHYWFFGPIPSGRLYPPHLIDFNLINWGEILSQIPLFLTMIFIFTLSFLVNISGMEAFLKEDVDVDREVKITGYANLLTTLFGGIAGCLSASQTIPNIQQGGKKYLSAIAASLLAIGILFIDSYYMNFIPKSLLGAAPIFLGAIFLVEWGFKPMFRLPLKDYLLLLTILFIVIAFGFLYGTLAGLLMAAGFFIHSYSQVDNIRFSADGSTYQSNVERSIQEREVLDEKGSDIFILKIYGFIFFGTSHYLLKRVKERLQDRSKDPMRYLILDFTWVNNIDASAASVFTKLLELSKAMNFSILFAQANDVCQKQLILSGIKKENFFRTLDYAMEWAENKVLGLKTFEPAQESPELLKILSYFELIEFKEGDLILNQGEIAKELYYLYSGKAIVLLKNRYGEEIRLRTLGKGTFLGELGFFSFLPRSSSIMAETPVKLYKITYKQLKDIEFKDPHLVVHFYEELSRILSERIASQNIAIEHFTLGQP